MGDRVCKRCGQTTRWDAPEIEVYGMKGLHLGTVTSFGKAKDMQLADLPEELREHYAGIGSEGQPLFHADSLTADLEAKYSIGIPEAA